MKITRKQLRQIIREEILQEQKSDMPMGNDPHPGGPGPRIYNKNQDTAHIEGYRTAVKISFREVSDYIEAFWNSDPQSRLGLERKLLFEPAKGAINDSESLAKSLWIDHIKKLVRKKVERAEWLITVGPSNLKFPKHYGVDDYANELMRTVERIANGIGSMYRKVKPNDITWYSPGENRKWTIRGEALDI